MWETEYKVVVAKLEKFERAVGNIVKNPDGEEEGEQDEEEGGDDRKRTESKKYVVLFSLGRFHFTLFFQGPEK